MQSCKDQQSDEDIIDIQLNEINGSNRQILLTVKNNSDRCFCLLDGKYEVKPKAFTSVDSTWIDISYSFYFELGANKIPDKKNKKSRELPKDLLPAMPEMNAFYNEICNQINKINHPNNKETKDIIAEIFKSSLFLSEREIYYDTIDIMNYFLKYQVDSLKLVSSYPKIYLFETNLAFIRFIESIVEDSLGMKFPEKLDGYEIYDLDLKSDSIIVK